MEGPQRPGDEPLAQMIQPIAIEIDPAHGLPALHAHPKVKAVEDLVAVGDWKAICNVLGPPTQPSELPPILGLVYAVARNEIEGAGAAPSPTELGVQCLARLGGLSTSSALALVLTKRLLRKTPVSWQKKPAPPPRVSAMIVLVTLMIGSAIGWLLSSGIIRFR